MSNLPEDRLSLEAIVEGLTERKTRSQQKGREYTTVLRIIKTIKRNMKIIHRLNLRQLSKTLPRDNRSAASRKSADDLGIPTDIQKAAKALAAITKENFLNPRSSFYQSVKTLPDHIKDPAMAIMLTFHAQTNNPHFHSGIPTLDFFRSAADMKDAINQYEAALKGITNWEFVRPVGESIEGVITLLESMRVDDKTFKRALALFSEHEMNVDAGDERPERGFDAVMKLADMHADGRKLTEKQKQTIVDYIRRSPQSNSL